MRPIVAMFAMVLLCPPMVMAQGAPGSGQAETWGVSASVYFYQVVDDRNYAQPTIAADRGWLHLEARYNYEDIDTGSLWFGYNMGGGDALSWELTPILGAVFGSTDGVAPGYKGSVSWRSLEFYSEGEYVVTSDAADRFFYNWSELTVSPVEWWRIGLVTQRTRAYETEREIQRGLLMGFSYKSLTSAIHVFNPDDTHPVIVFSASLAF
ncbi:MAG: hypothetical protein ACRD1W_12950 [Vicinamibacterales bacterium]